MDKLKTVALTFVILFSLNAFSQEVFTRKDSLIGGLRFERTCYDLRRVELNIKVDPEQRFISGYSELAFNTVNDTRKIQVDLFENMKIDSIISDKKSLTYKREFNSVFINFPEFLTANSSHKIRIYYNGNPIVAKNAPWDGGFDWKKDKNGKHFIGVAVQGTGASLWYPCKDTQTDEPEEGAGIKIAVPNGLMDVSNGRFKGSIDLKNGYTRWDWEVKNPINNYDITVNIGDYVHIHDTFKNLDLDYYVLSYNEEKAREHFGIVRPMMECYESRFGPYPFTEDGFKLVETPYLGMEHQSAVAYGNKYLNGYLGADLSGTGIGVQFDFIIIHESGHEWFGNSITSKDVADMWIHEGFTTYAESVYVECVSGYDTAMKYINGLKKNIGNDTPIIGHFGVNNEGSNDMYFKGAIFINTLRHIVNDDAKWWQIIYKYSTTYSHKIISTEDVLGFFNHETGMDFTPLFNQYLRTTKVPQLSLQIGKKDFVYRWENVNADFNMPVDIRVNGKVVRLFPLTQEKSYKITDLKAENLEVLTDHFYVTAKK